MKTIKKLDHDVSRCLAKLTAIKVYVNNRLTEDLYIGKVDYYQRNIRLFSQKSDIIRLNQQDAIKDAENLAKQNGF